MKRRLLFFLLFLSALIINDSNAQTYDVGVFYMPFWNYQVTGDPLSGNWRLIKNYDDFLIANGYSSRRRKPANIYSPSSAWYDEGMKSVHEKQLSLMKQHGIDFIIHNTFFSRKANGSYGPYFAHPMVHFQDPTFNNHGVKLAIMWADRFLDLVAPGDTNCDSFFASGGGFDQMINYWKQQIFSNGSVRPHYKTINGKPVLYLNYMYMLDITLSNDPGGLCNKCAGNAMFNGVTETVKNAQKVRRLLQEIETRMGADLYFVYVTKSITRKVTDAPSFDWDLKWVYLRRYPDEAGFDAMTSYGYQFFDYEDTQNSNYSYATMKSIHNEFWDYIFSYSTPNVDYHVPVLSGWNQGPMSMEAYYDGNPDTNPYGANPGNLFTIWNVDNAISSPTTFEGMLQDARAKVAANPSKTKNIVTICCWNEYGEGSYIEPTERWGYQYLEKVRGVLGECLSGSYINGGTSYSINTTNSIATGSTTVSVHCADATSYTWTKTSGSLSYSASGPNASFYMTSGQSISFTVTAKNSANQVLGTRNIAFYNSGSFLAYPNPSSSSVSIDAPQEFSFDVVIFDEKMQKLKDERNIRGKDAVDVSSLKPGRYHLQLYLGDTLVDRQTILIKR